MNAPAKAAKPKLSSHYKKEYTMSVPIVYIGLDVAKLHLDAHGQNQGCRLENHSKGHAQLIQWLGRYSAPVHVICEATGGYEQPVVAALMAASIPVSVVAPARVRALARSLGILAKTDQIDAKLLERFGQLVEPSPCRPQSSAQLQLGALVSFRLQLLDKIQALQNQIEHLPKGPVTASAQRLARSYQRELLKIDQAIDAFLAQEPVFDSHFKRLCQVQGVGRFTALSVLAFLPEIGTLSKKQAAALAGLAPRNKDSGQFKGYRSIGGGRHKLRACLYMAALTASRSNPVLKAFYQRLISSGKKPKVALTALMRKLIILLNHLIKNPNFQLA